MLYTEDMVRMNIRNRDGKRVFYLDKGDSLTPGARDWLNRERIGILSARSGQPEQYRLCNGAILQEKPEHMTHLNGNVLVLKTHPRIRFRGAVDSLEAELLLCGQSCKLWREELGQLLALARRLIRCEVMDEPVPEGKLCGLTEAQLRQHSHDPLTHYGQGHFMPEVSDGPVILALNRCRTAVRAAELAAAEAFADGEGNCTRPDILQGLNRMSSMVYILMIREKAKNRP